MFLEKDHSKKLWMYYLFIYLWSILGIWWNPLVGDVTVGPSQLALRPWVKRASHPPRVGSYQYQISIYIYIYVIIINETERNSSYNSKLEF